MAEVHSPPWRPAGPRHIPAPVPSPPDHEARREPLQLRQRPTQGGIAGTRAPQRAPRVGVGGAAPLLLVDQSAHLLDDVRFAAESGPGDRSVVGGAAPLDGSGSRVVGTSGSPACPSSAGWFSRPPMPPRRVTARSDSTHRDARVEPGHDLAALPAIVLADLVEWRSGSLAGVTVQRRLLDLQQYADFLGCQDLIAHRRTRPLFPVVCGSRSSPPPQSC